MVLTLSFIMIDNGEQLWNPSLARRGGEKKGGKLCVYYRAKMKAYPHTKGTPKDEATFEHIDNNDGPTKDNIALCCAACNSSKGTKKLLDWLDSPYCKEKI